MWTFHAKRGFGHGDLKTSINGKVDLEGNIKSPINYAFSEASGQ